MATLLGLNWLNDEVIICSYKTCYPGALLSVRSSLLLQSARYRVATAAETVTV